MILHGQAVLIILSVSAKELVQRTRVVCTMQITYYLSAPYPSMLISTQTVTITAGTPAETWHQQTPLEFNQYVNAQ